MARLTRALALLVGLILSACSITPSPSPSVVSSETATAAPTSTITPLPTPTPEPPLSLPLPLKSDPRSVRFTVKGQSDLTVTTSGHVVVTVTNLSDTAVSELVLRWPTALKEIIFLAPFEPSAIRIREGGPPLYQEWTRWVEGPGERGEPADTTSLGWGPLLPGATITITLIANRIADQRSAFDLQFLAGEAILTTESGQPAEQRVELP
jgi:hypothetical protein